MLKNRVENDRKLFWNSRSFILRTRKISRKRSGKIQNIYVILNFPALDFLVHKIKEWEFQKNCLSFFTLLIYIPWMEVPLCRNGLKGNLENFFIDCQIFGTFDGEHAKCVAKLSKILKYAIYLAKFFLKNSLAH